jgi:hypothetical protein
MSRIFCFVALLLPLLVPLPGIDFLNSSCIALEKSSQIKGQVIDAETKASIEFANILLYLLPETNSPIQITATSPKGEFSFAGLKPGEYYIIVHFMGYKDFRTQPFTLTNGTTIFRLEPISIHIEAVDLKEITVSANSEKPVFQLDKKTIYVENQLAGAGGSAADLLLKLPSLTQNPDGKIAIHGNSNLLVYINGKPSSLKGDELLQNTSAAEVKKIELITSPSAKYDASGSAGIINLITKKNTIDGLNGNIQAAADHIGGYSSDLLLNYKYHKFSFFTGLDHNARRNEGDLDYITNYLTDRTQFTKTGNLKAQRINTGFRTGADYQPTLSDKISFSGNAGSFETSNNGNWATALLNNGPEFNYLKRNIATDSNNRKGHYGGADFTYEHKFKSPNKGLSFSSIWNTVNYDDSYLNLVNDLAGKEQIKQATLLTKDYRNFQLNADYTTPTGKVGNLEIGYQLTVNNEQETYYSELNNPSPPLITNQETHFDGRIQAGYATWQFKIKRLDLKVGLRAEDLNREMNTIGNRFYLHRFDLYPSLNSSFKINSNHEILLNYSRRTDQLKTIQLDPLPRWYDFYNVVIGNPDLKNEITNKIALDYLINLHNLSLTNQLYYYNTADKIEVISSLYRDGIVQNRYENMGSEKTLGFELNATWTIGTKINLNEKLDIIDTWLDVHLNNLEKQRNYRQWYSVTTANITLTPITLLEFNFSYYGPSLTAQSNIDQLFMAGVSFRQMFLKKKLTFTLTGRDVLGMYRKIEKIQGTDFNQSVTTANKFPVRFSLSYKFNNYKRDERRVAKAPILE